MIAKAFILAKDNSPITAKILPDNKIIRDHGAFPATIAKRGRPIGLSRCPPVRLSGLVRT
jgi:hypothetical protein